MQMEKQLTIVGDNIKLANDKKYVFETYENMLNSLFDFEGIATKIKFDKTDNSFKLQFNLKVCKDGDLLWILLIEYIKTITETEDNVNIMIDEIEQTGKGTTYRLYKYKSNK